MTDDDDDETAPHADSDPEMNRLLPRRQRRHRVRIQGQLAIVHTVSVANLRQQAKVGTPTSQVDTHRGETRTSPIGLWGSHDGSEGSDDDEDGFVAERDAQFRGYGIGGAGNIRRPTDVMGAPPSASPSLLSLIHTPASAPAPPSNATMSGRWRWRMAGLLRGLGGPKGRSKACAGG